MTAAGGGELGAEAIAVAREARQRFRSLAAWLWWDAVWRFKQPIAGILIRTGTGILFQLAALALLFGYARALESGREVNLLGQALPVRSSAALLFGTALLALLLLALFALLDYSSGIRRLELRRSYEEFCAQRVLVLLSRLPHPGSPIANRMLAEGALARGGRRETKQCGVVLKLVLDAMLPLGGLVVYGLALFYLNAWLSGLIMPLLGIAALFLYRINTAAARSSLAAERYAGPAAVETRRLVKRTWESATPISYGDRSLKATWSSGSVKRDRDTFFERYILEARTRLVINGLSAAALLSIVLVAGTGILSGAERWSVLVAYLVGLNRFLSSLARIGHTLTQLSRRYPQIRRYADFVSDAERAGPEPADSDRHRTIRLAVSSLANGEPEVELPTGRRSLLVGSGSVNRALVAALQDRTTPRSAGASPAYWFVGDPDCLGSTLRECLGLPPEVAAKALIPKLAALLPADAVAELPAIDVDEILTESQLAALPVSVVRALKVLAATYSRRPAIVLRETDLEVLHDPPRHRVPHALADRVVIGVCEQPPDLTAEPEDTIILAIKGGALVGWCSAGWLRRNPDALAGLSNPLRPDSEVAGWSAEEDDGAEV